MTSDEIGISISWNWVWALLLLQFAFFWRRLARDNWSNWKAANQLIPLSFENTNSAVERMRLGCLGLILGAICWLLWAIFFVLAFDQLLTNGEFILQRSNQILSYVLNFLSAVAQLVLRVLRVLAQGAET